MALPIGGLRRLRLERAGCRPRAVRRAARTADASTTGAGFTALLRRPSAPPRPGQHPRRQRRPPASAPRGSSGTTPRPSIRSPDTVTKSAMAYSSTSPFGSLRISAGSAPPGVRAPNTRARPAACIPPANTSDALYDVSSTRMATRPRVRRRRACRPAETKRGLAIRRSSESRVRSVPRLRGLSKKWPDTPISIVSTPPGILAQVEDDDRQRRARRRRHDRSPARAAGIQTLKWTYPTWRPPGAVSSRCSRCAASVGRYPSFTCSPLLGVTRQREGNGPARRVAKADRDRGCPSRPAAGRRSLPTAGSRSAQPQRSLTTDGTASLGSWPPTCSMTQPGRTPARPAGPACSTFVTTGCPSMGVISTPRSPLTSPSPRRPPPDAPAGRTSKCDRPRRASISRRTPRKASGLPARRGTRPELVTERRPVRLACGLRPRSVSWMACHAASKVAAPSTPRPTTPAAGEGVCSAAFAGVAGSRHIPRHTTSAAMPAAAATAAEVHRVGVSSGSAQAQDHRRAGQGTIIARGWAVDAGEWGRAVAR